MKEVEYQIKINNLIKMLPPEKLRDMFLLFLSQKEKEVFCLSSIAPNQNEIRYAKSLYAKFNL